MGNTFGTIFKITSWGESHGQATGVIIDGCPSNITITPEDIQIDLDRRKPGQSPLTSQRQEDDKVQILSGLSNNKTLGSPISLLIPNKDVIKSDYDEINQAYRPSHADYTYQKKFGITDPSGSGRASARETLARVAAGAIAKKILKLSHNIKIIAYVDSVFNIKCPDFDDIPNLNNIESSLVRCPHPQTSAQIIEAIQNAQNEGDSLGGTIKCFIQNTPPGIGEPVFDKLEADLAKAMLSIPAAKGFEVGSGFSGTLLKGSQHNDLFENIDGKIRTKTNHSGGIQGGISNGELIYFRVAFKPTSTINKDQLTLNKQGFAINLKAKGRHDPCVLPRAVPIVEAMAALVLVDHLLLHNASQQYSQLQ